MYLDLAYPRDFDRRLGASSPHRSAWSLGSDKRVMERNLLMLLSSLLPVLPGPKLTRGGAVSRRSLIVPKHQQ